MTFDEWWKEHREELTQRGAESAEKPQALLVWNAAWEARGERDAQIAIDKGIGNGHMETCAWIAAKIREPNI